MQSVIAIRTPDTNPNIYTQPGLGRIDQLFLLLFSNRARTIANQHWRGSGQPFSAHVQHAFPFTWLTLPSHYAVNPEPRRARILITDISRINSPIIPGGQDLAQIRRRCCDSPLRRDGHAPPSRGCWGVKEGEFKENRKRRRDTDTYTRYVSLCSTRGKINSANK